MAYSAEPTAGIVVIDVGKNSEAAIAGLNSGDVLRSWSREANKGTFNSPFDLKVAEIEQASVGEVTVYGENHAQNRNWALKQGDWGIRTRPVLSVLDLKLYLKAKRLAQDGDLESAFAVWQSLKTDKSPTLYSWCLADTAYSLTHTQPLKNVDVLYRKAISNLGDNVSAQIVLLLEWSQTLEERNLTKAHQLLQEALRKGETLKDEPLLRLSILNELIIVNNWRRDLATSQQFGDQALGIENEVAPHNLIAVRTLIALVQVSMNRGDDKAAQTYLDEAQPIVAAIDPHGVDYARYLGELGTLEKRRGDLNRAKGDFAQAVDILETSQPEGIDLARNLGRKAFISERQGDLTTAEILLQRALALYEKRPSDPTVGIALTNDMAMLAYERRDIGNALKYEVKAEQIINKVAPISIDHAGCLINLGLESYENDDLRGAEKYLVLGLTIIKKVAPNSEESAILLASLAGVARKNKQFQESKAYAVQAKRILDELAPGGADMADLLQELGEDAQHDHDLNGAEKYYRASLAIEERVEPAKAERADTLASLAEVSEEKGQLDAAAQQYEMAINILESQMGRLGGNEAVRSMFRAGHDTIYKRYIDVLIRQGNTERAFEVFERSRARSLLEMLADAHIDVEAHVAASLLNQEQSLRKRFSVESDSQIRLLNGSHTPEQLAASEAKLNDVLSEFSLVESQIRASSPSYAQLTQPETTTIKDVQQNLLDPETLLLEYCLGDNHSYVWLIGSKFTEFHELPGRHTIEEAGRNFYRNIVLHKGVVSTSESQSKNSALTLAQMILGPVASQLAHKRLLIIADGVLEYIPFAALPSLGTVGPNSVLVSNHEIINLPSASVLMTLRQERAGRKLPPKAVAVLADPVFDAKDVRVNHQGVREEAASISEKESLAATRAAEITRTRWSSALGSDGSFYFSRLSYSRSEANAIVAVSPAGQSLEALDFHANRSLATSPDLADYRVLHFATHGLLDTKHPELSGLLLSMVDKNGAPQIGLLSLEDIYNLDLPVDMVVLSACETALGKEVKGEGLIGLTRGFLYAGASRVVASLWDVNDVATSKFMKTFYYSIEKEQLSPPAALRKAQLKLREDPRWSAPYYWAGFTLEGEWK